MVPNSEMSSQTAQIVALSSEQTKRAADIEARQATLTDNQLSLTGDVTDLISVLSEEKNMPITINLNADQIGTKTYEVIKQKYGNLVIANDE